MVADENPLKYSLGRLFLLPASLLVTCTHSVIHSARSQFLSRACRGPRFCGHQKNKSHFCSLRVHRPAEEREVQKQTQPLHTLENVLKIGACTGWSRSWGSKRHCLRKASQKQRRGNAGFSFRAAGAWAKAQGVRDSRQDTCGRNTENPGRWQRL